MNNISCVLHKNCFLPSKAQNQLIIATYPYLLVKIMTEAPAPLNFNIFVTIIDKQQSPDCYQNVIVNVSSNDTIKDLKYKINRETEWHDEKHIHIAYKGKLLNYNQATLESVGLVPTPPSNNMPKIYITCPKKKSNENTTNYDGNDINQSQNIIDDNKHNDNDNDDEEKQCRLCFETTESDFGLGFVCSFYFILFIFYLFFIFFIYFTH